MTVKIKKIMNWIKEYEFLSMDYLSKIYWGGAFYPSLRHALIATKTNNDFVRENIRKATLDQLDEIELRIVTRPNWNAAIFMRDLLALKYGISQIMLPDLSNPMKLFKLLAQTGQAKLEFHNKMHDNYWGICDCGDLSRGCDSDKAYNYLGKATEEVRAKIQKKIAQFNPQKKCHCGNEAKSGILYSLEWDVHVDYFCNDKECRDLCVKRAVAKSSDKIVLDYNPEGGSTIAYVPLEGEATVKNYIQEVAKTESILNSTVDEVLDSDVLEYYGYTESGMWIEQNKSLPPGVSSHMTTTTATERKWETTIIKGSIK